MAVLTQVSMKGLVIVSLVCFTCSVPWSLDALHELIGVP